MNRNTKTKPEDIDLNEVAGVIPTAHKEPSKEDLKKNRKKESQRVHKVDSRVARK